MKIEDLVIGNYYSVYDYYYGRLVEIHAPISANFYTLRFEDVYAKCTLKGIRIRSDLMANIAYVKPAYNLQADQEIENYLGGIDETRKV
jgi:hypothetical protein